MGRPKMQAGSSLIRLLPRSLRATSALQPFHCAVMATFGVLSSVLWPVLLAIAGLARGPQSKSHTVKYCSTVIVATTSAMVLDLGRLPDDA